MSKLEVAEKLSKIVFAGMGAFVLGIAGWQLKQGEFKRGNAQFCFSNIGNIQNLSNSFANNESVPSFLFGKFASGCDISEIKSSEFLNLLLFTEQRSISDVELLEPDVVRIADAFIAIGSESPESYGQVNFNLLDEAGAHPAITSGSAPQTGDILQARWPVNLRDNTQSTNSGNNAIVGLVSEGQCIELLGQPIVLRSQYWAEVARQDCPK